jgi:hypothetical protein
MHACEKMQYQYHFIRDLTPFALFHFVSLSSSLPSNIINYITQLLYGNVGAIAAVAALYGPGAFQTDNDNSIEYDGYIYATIICVFFSFAFSAVSVLILMAIPETMIKVSLIFVVISTGLLALWRFLSGSIALGVMGLVFFALCLCYARRVWPRIPFASVNLVTACTAIKSNWGVVLYGYFFALCAAGWSILWAFAFVGAFDKTYTCDANDVCSDPNYGILFGLFVSYFFTHQVLQVSSCSNQIPY